MRNMSSKVAEQFLGRGLLHADVGEELLSSIFQTGPKDIDNIVDNQETVVVPLTDVDGDGRVLLVVSLHVELLLLGELTGVDDG